METGKRIQILLSTYNGEKYLREQLDSYLTLENFDQCCILVRDDGSTDTTRSILQKYAAKYDFSVEYGENLGVNASYQWLIEHSSQTCGYFAFSDQDDVWLPGKLCAALAALEREPSGIPLLFASRSFITDAELRPKGMSALPVRGLSFYNAMVQNILPGHTLVFNRALRDVLAVHGCLGAHVVDWWLYLTASAVGKVLFSSESSVFHRQHGDNSVGYRLNPLSGLARKLQYLREGKGNAISLQLSAFQKSWDGELPAEYQEELTGYLNGLGSFSIRLDYLRHSRVFRQKRREDWGFRLLYLMGKYDL